MNVREVTSAAAAKLLLTFACGLYDRMQCEDLPSKRESEAIIATGLPPDGLAE